MAGKKTRVQVIKGSLKGARGVIRTPKYELHKADLVDVTLDGGSKLLILAGSLRILEEGR